MSTELGKMIKSLRIRKDDITQKTLAADLNYSTGYLSNIIMGKIDPDIEFLVKCKNYFNLNKQDTIELFNKALLSCKTIILQDSYLTKRKKELLIKVIVAILLLPDQTSFDSNLNNIEKAVENIVANFNLYHELKTFT
ncbi:MAG: helix-turn-helix domain-containing protein [Spirochaetaceae bacterium]|nr:helix-turn-helix domain-containing protein [Spirochaetaceae bacterium]